MSNSLRARKTRKQKTRQEAENVIKPHNHEYKISCCMIVKNEVVGIRDTLLSVSPLVDEIIIVDTGSTDGTQDICKEFDKVKLFQPDPILFMTKEEDGFDRIDFAANRNVAHTHATGDWIFILDGDEKITRTDGLHHHVEFLEDRAEPMLLKAHQVFMDDTWPAYYLSGHYLGKREPEKAKVWARRALVNPKSIDTARAWHWLIHATLMTEGLDEAEKLLYQALVLHPNYPDLGWLRTIYALARWEVAYEGAESDIYAMLPQKSHQINRSQIARHLGIQWPFVVVKKVEEKSDDSSIRC